MPKAYWIARIDVTEPSSYAKYAKLATKAFEQHRARVLARGGQYIGLEGEARERNVVIEFEDMESALACYISDAYREAAGYRAGAAEGEILIVEGV